MLQTPARKGPPQTKSRAGVRIVVHATLRSSVHSRANRRRAQELAWDWVRAKWPRLMPSASEMQNSHLEYALPGQELAASTSADGSTWTLSVAYSERGGMRTWVTRVLVADAGDTDVMGLQTCCSDLPHLPLVVAPPRLLGVWVERLALQDGGFAVLGEPRNVGDQTQLAAFCEHVLSKQRTLPVIALANSPRSRYYGVDPRGLAEAVRGLAHVACLTPEVSAGVSARLGTDFGVVPGAARIYAPHFSLSADPAAHPLFRDKAAADESGSKDAGAFRRLLCRQICALSVVATKNFEDLVGKT